MYCSHCDQSFTAQRFTARYCTPACRKAAFKARLAVLSVPELPEAVLSVPEVPEAVTAPSGGISDAIAPLRWQRPIGDRDIRHVNPPAPGTEISVPDLPACLDRRGSKTGTVVPELFKEAA